MREMFSPLVLSIPASLFAAYRAEVRGETYFRSFGGVAILRKAGSFAHPDQRYLGPVGR
jgi:hypothetical protein